jgi:Lrp/AsnC family leucine-responsive transcriptional regulator
MNDENSRRRADMKLDAIDRRILAALQSDGRLSNVDLADAVGLSPSPCLRRVKMLEKAEVIAGYHATLERKAVGLGLTVFVGVKVERHHDEQATAFRDAVGGLAEVVSCHLVSGEADFLLQVVVPDLAGYERFLLGTLLKLPGVSDIRSNFAIQTVKSGAPLPLDHLPGTTDAQAAKR